MAPRLAGLARLLAAVLLVQAVLAPALCLARAARHGPAPAICALGDDGGGHGGAPQAPAAPGHDVFCLACHALPQGALPDAPLLPPPAWEVAAAAFAPAAPAAPPPSIRGPPVGVRAPPLLPS